MKKIYTNAITATTVLTLLLMSVWIPGFAQTRQAKEEANPRPANKVLKDEDEDANEAKQNAIAFAWYRKASDPDLTFKEIVNYCDSLFAVPGNIDTGEDGVYKKYSKWKMFWGVRLDASTGKLHNFNKTISQRLYQPQNLAGLIGSTQETDCGGVSTLQAGIQSNSAGGPDGYGWNFMGPQNVHSGNSTYQMLGRVTGISVNPSNHNEIYAASEWGGLWKTSNGGSTWTCLTDNNQTISGIGVSAFAVDYSATPHAIYLSLGYPNNSLFPWIAYLFTGGRAYGIFYSLDDGNTFDYIRGLTGSPLNINWGDDQVNDIKINPAFPNFVFFSSKYKLARLDVGSGGSNLPTLSSANMAAVIDYSLFLPSPNTSARSNGFGHIEFLPGTPANDMFAVFNAIYGNTYLTSAQLFYIPNCTAPTPGPYIDVTNNLNFSSANNITDGNFSSSPSGWNVGTNWVWSSANQDMEFTNGGASGSGQACLETSVEGNYISPAYNYTIKFDATVAPNTILDVVLRDPNTSCLYSTCCTLSPTNDIVVYHLDNTCPACSTAVVVPFSSVVSTSSSSSIIDNYYTRLMFRATSGASYVPGTNGPIKIDNVEVDQNYFDFMDITTSAAAPTTIFAQAGRLNSSTYLQSSTTNGASWGTITTTTKGIIKASTVNPNLFYYGYSGGANFYSYNASTSTTTGLGGSLGHVDIRSIALANTNPAQEDIYVGEDGGLSGQVGGTWKNLTSGTYPATTDGTTPKDVSGKTEIYTSSLAYNVGSSIHGGDILLSTQDNTVLHSNQLNITNWWPEQCCDVYAAQYGKRPTTNSSYFFLLNGGGNPSDLECSACGAYLETNVQPYRKIKTTINGEYFAGPELYPGPVTNADIFKVDVSGSTWNNLTNGVPSWPGNVIDQDVWGFAPDPVDPNFIVAYLNRDGSFWTNTGDFAVTSNGGATWNVLPNPFGYNYLDMAVDPRPYNGNPNLKRFWAGANWYSGSGSPIAGSNRVFQFVYDITSGHWTPTVVPNPTDYSSGLPDGPINALVYDEQSHYLFAGTDVGVYARYVDGPPGQPSPWVCYSMNLPNAFITGLDINRCTGKLYVSSYGRGGYDAELPPGTNWDDPTDAVSTDVISTNTTWTSDRDETKSIVVMPNAVLTIQNCTLSMGRDKNITVKAGGVLVVDHATITNSCGTLWGCISVEGDGTAQNLHGLTQGAAFLSYATLSNAYAGVFIGGQYYDGSDSPDYDFDPSHDGGYVSADHTTFHNCVTGAWILPFQYKQNSKFTYCTFEATDFLNSHHYTDYSAGATNPRRFGSVRGIWFGYWTPTATIGGVTIDNCTFQTVNGTSVITGGAFNPDADLRGTGIISSNASYQLTNSTFSNLTRGIQATNDASSVWWCAPYVDNNTFTNIWRAASFLDVNNVVFQNNTITIGGPCTYPTTSTPFNLDPVGAYFSQAQGLWIYKNNISMAGASTWSSGHKTYGIIMNNTNNNTYAETSNPYLAGVLSNTFYKNTLATDIGICAYQDNTGTQFKCNNLQGNAHTALSVWGPNTTSPGLIDDQGTLSAPIGNEFTKPSPTGCGTTYFDLASGSMDPAFAFNYFEFNTTQFVASCLSSTSVSGFTSITTPTFTSIKCPTYGTSCCADLTTLPTYYCPLPKMAHQDNLQTISQSEHAIDSMQSNLDGGNSPSLLSSVNNSSLNSSQLKNILMTSQYLSDKVLIAAINRVPAMEDNDLKQLILKNSGLNKNVWNALNRKHTDLASDPDVLNAQSTLSGRIDLEAAMGDALQTRNDALKTITNAYVFNEDWADAAQLYASKQAWEIAIGFYLKAGDVNSATALVQNIQDPSENKLLTLYINHIAHRYTGAMPDKNTIDSLSIQEQQSLKELASNPYTHAGELARVWLDKSKGHNILELMPVGDGIQGADANAENNNKQLTQLDNSNALVKVFPNPAQNIVRVELRKGTWGNAAVINCYDMNSKQMAKMVPDANSNIADINTTTWLSGVYMIIVQLSNGDETIQKLIIEKP